MYKRQLEDIHEDQSNCHLEPSLLLVEQEEMSIVQRAKSCGHMVTRGRCNPFQRPKIAASTCQPYRRSFLPEAMMNTIDYGRQSDCQSPNSVASGAKSKSNLSVPANERSSINIESRIFSISSSVLLTATLVALVSMICVCNGDRALFVSGQMSPLVMVNPGASQPVQPQSQQHQQQHQKHSLQQQAPQTAAGAAMFSVLNGRGPVMMRQVGNQMVQTNPMLLVQSGPQQVASSSSYGTVAGALAAASSTKPCNSIDRFDSGEQIRPPLLRPATTLAPSTMAKPQQVSVNSQFSMQTSASHESYLSPDDRPVVVRQTGSQLEPETALLVEQRQRSTNQVKQVSQPVGDVRHWAGQSASAGEAKRSAISGRDANQLLSEASNSSPAGDSDEADYEDEQSDVQQQPQQPENGHRVASEPMGGSGGDSATRNQRRAMLVGQIRRPSEGLDVRAAQTGPMARVGSTQAQSSIEGADESEPSDDYSGSNDEAYFSRKSSQPAQRGSAGQSLAAGSQQLSSAQRQPINGGLNGNERPFVRPQPGGEDQDEGRGFGPGPNEAYLAERAESMGAAPGGVGVAADADSGEKGSPVEGEEEGAFAAMGAGPDSSDLLGPSEEEPRSDRRSASPQGGANLSPVEASAGSDGRPRQAESGTAYAAGGAAGGAEAGATGQPSVGQLDNSLDSDMDEGTEGSEDAPSVGAAYSPSSRQEVKSWRPVQTHTSLARAQSATTAAPVASGPQNRVGNLFQAVRAIPSSQSLVQQQPGAQQQQQQQLQSQQKQDKNQNQPLPQLRPARQPTKMNYQHRSQQHDQQQQQQQQLHFHRTPYNPQNNPSHVGKYFIN